MRDEAFDVVTGAFGYTGGGIARALLARGRRVRTLTGHPDRPGRDPRIEARAYDFERPEALARALAGADALYNTYWIRFGRKNVSFDLAVERSEALFAAAATAGVRRVVHVSVTHPDVASAFPYFRGKAIVEQALADRCASWAVVRPTVVFGPGDILMNNIAWLLRRFPVFAIPGDGAYRVRPVHVDDVGELCVRMADASDNVVVDAIGPDTFTFEELVAAIREAVGSRSRLLHVPRGMAGAAASAIGVLVRDVLLTDHELGGLMAEKAYSDGPTTGDRRFADWLRDARSTLGRRYASEIRRHFER